MKKKVAKKLKNVQLTNEQTTENINKKDNKMFIFWTVVLIIILLLVFETIITIKIQTRMNKKPEIIAQWKAIYKAVICSVVYNNHYISIDERFNQIQVQDKMTGEVIGIYESKGVDPIWAAESKDGSIYFYTRNSNILYIIKDFKKIGELPLQGITSICGLAINTKDEIIAVDGPSRRVVIYNLNGEKISELKTAEILKQPVGRVFCDGKDNLYVVNNQPCEVSMFTRAGQFLGSIKFSNKEICSLVNVAVTPDGYIYINDFPGSQVLVYNKKGKLMSKFNTDKLNTFVITYPATITGGSDGYIYVGTHHIGVFKPIIY